MGQVDTFLLMTVSLALTVGIVGIINTMLMSTTERFTEFGVLRTNGWSQTNILTLVTLESAYLGLLAGLVGCALAWAGAFVLNQFMTGGIHLGLTPSLFGAGAWPVGRDGDAGRNLPRVARGQASAHGGDSTRVALTKRSVDDRGGERIQVVQERQPAGRGPPRCELPDRAGPIRIHRRPQRLRQEHAPLPAWGPSTGPARARSWSTARTWRRCRRPPRTFIAAIASDSSSSRST